MCKFYRFEPCRTCVGYDGALTVGPKLLIGIKLRAAVRDFWEKLGHKCLKTLVGGVRGHMYGVKPRKETVASC